MDAQAGPYVSIARFGEAWTECSSTGQALIVHSVEALIAAVSLPSLSCEPAEREAALSRLQSLRSEPLAEQGGRLRAAELLTALRLSRC